MLPKIDESGKIDKNLLQKAKKFARRFIDTTGLEATLDSVDEGDSDCEIGYHLAPGNGPMQSDALNAIYFGVKDDERNATYFRTVACSKLGFEELKPILNVIERVAKNHGLEYHVLQKDDPGRYSISILAKFPRKGLPSASRTIGDIDRILSRHFYSQSPPIWLSDRQYGDLINDVCAMSAGIRNLTRDRTNEEDEITVSRLKEKYSKIEGFFEKKGLRSHERVNEYLKNLDAELKRFYSIIDVKNQVPGSINKESLGIISQTVLDRLEYIQEFIYRK